MFDIATMIVNQMFLIKLTSFFMDIAPFLTCTVLGFFVGYIQSDRKFQNEQLKKVEEIYNISLVETKKGGFDGEAIIPVRSTIDEPSKIPKKIIKEPNYRTSIDIITPKQVKPIPQVQNERYFGISRQDTALVLIDMQKDFLSPNGRVGSYFPPSAFEGFGETISSVERLLKAARQAGITIAHSRSFRYGTTIRLDLKPKYLTTRNSWDKLHYEKRNEKLDDGYELWPSLRPLSGEIVVDKWTYGAFGSTELETELRKRNVRKIILAGVLSNVCVSATAIQAVDRFFRVCLVEEGTGSFNKDWHGKALDQLNEPQLTVGHAEKAIGLYFGELAKVDQVEAALGKLQQRNRGIMKF